jgi:DNA-binding ferritin-like protein (Dps family)
MGKIIDTIIGDLSGKREWKETEARAKALPSEYSTAYKEIKNYMFRTAGLETMEPLKSLVDMLEEAAANGKHVLEVTGPDVAAFADELVRDEKSYFEKERAKLNASVAEKLPEVKDSE